MTEVRNSGCAPPAFTSFSDEATPSTSREGTADTSCVLDDYTWISYETCAYPWNVLNISLADATYVNGLRDISNNGNTAHWLPVSSRGDNDAKPSTGQAGMEESSAILEDARFPNGSCGGQWYLQYYPADVTSTTYGYTDMAENGSTGYWPPVSSSGGDEAVSSTSRTGVEESSATLETDGRNATGTEENQQQELCGVCSVCGRVYTRLHALQRHASEHYGGESYICATCYLPSVEITKVVRHCQNSTKEKRYKCETCGTSFKKSSHLNAHQRTHTGIKPYKCETCGKSFTQSGNLHIHKRTHTDIKPYKCDTCGKSFKQLGHLNTHQLTHTGMKLYKCKTCGTSFTQLDRLKRHQLKHTGEKPHVCPKCMKSFHCKHYLKEHISLHTGAKPFVCEVCSESFGNSSSLRSHRLRHVDESPHQCAECGASFAERGILDGHVCEMHTCCLCGDSFSDVIQLATHLVTHRDGQP